MFYRGLLPDKNPIFLNLNNVEYIYKEYDKRITFAFTETVEHVEFENNEIRDLEFENLWIILKNNGEK